MQDATLCWINGRLMSGNEATIPVMDHGLLYGDDLFEGIRCYQQRAFRELVNEECSAREKNRYVL